MGLHTSGARRRLDPSTHACAEACYVAGCFRFSRTYGQPAEILFSNRISQDPRTAKPTLLFFKRYTVPLESHPATPLAWARSSMSGPCSSDSSERIILTLSTTQEAPKK